MVEPMIVEAWWKAHLVESEIHSRVMRDNVEHSTTIDPNPFPISVGFGFVTNPEWLTATGPLKALLLGPISSAPALDRAHAS